MNHSLSLSRVALFCPFLQVAREEELRAALAQAHENQRRGSNVPSGAEDPPSIPPPLQSTPQIPPTPHQKHNAGLTRGPRALFLNRAAEAQLAALRSQLDEALAEKAALQRQLAATKEVAERDVSAARAEVAAAKADAERIAAELSEARERVRSAEERAPAGAGGADAAEGQQARFARWPLLLYSPLSPLALVALLFASLLQRSDPPLIRFSLVNSQPRARSGQRAKQPLNSAHRLETPPFLRRIMPPTMQDGEGLATLRANLEQTRAMLVDALAQKRRLTVRVRWRMGGQRHILFALSARRRALLSLGAFRVFA